MTSNVFGNRVKQTTTTTGTGTIDLIAAPDGFRNFSDEYSNGDDLISYLIVDDPEAPTIYEYGKGTFSTGTPNTFARDTVEGSSNSGSKVSLTGTNVIIATPTAADFNAVFGAGSWGRKSALVRAITTDTNQVAADDGKLILANGSGNSPVGLTYTLLAEATAGDGFTVTVRNDGSSGAVVINDDAASEVLTLYNEGDNATLKCDGTSWHIVARTVAPGVLSVTSDLTLTAEHDGLLILADGSGNSPAGLTLTFSSAATLGETFGIDIRNVGASGNITQATSNSPADGIDGSATKTLEPDQSNRVRCTGSTFYTIGGGTEVTSALTLYFQSTGQTITSAGSLTIAHGLGVAPTLIQVLLTCQTADGNYSTSDVLMIDNHGGEIGGSSARGVSIVPDATNLNIRFGSAANVFALLNKTTGNQFSATNANWTITFRAWA